MTVKSFKVQVPGDNAINIFVLCHWYFAIISVFPRQGWPEDLGKCAQILKKVAKTVAKPKMLILLSKTSTSIPLKYLQNDALKLFLREKIEINNHKCCHFLGYFFPHNICNDL